MPIPKSNSGPMTVVGPRYNSVEDMIRDTQGDKAADRHVASMAKRAVKDRLMIERGLKDLTMKEMAAKLRWTMKRLIAFEEGEDAHLTLGDIVEYATALGMKFSYNLETKGN